jgi:hypothetical protein
MTSTPYRSWLEGISRQPVAGSIGDKAKKGNTAVREDLGRGGEAELKSVAFTTHFTGGKNGKCVAIRPRINARLCWSSISWIDQWKTPNLT